MNPFLYRLQDTLLSAFVLFSYTSLVLYAFGVTLVAPQHMQVVNQYVQLYLAVFLLLRFHPYRYQMHVGFTELDRKVVFSGALFLLSTSILNNYVSNLRSAVTSTIHQNS